MRRAGRADKGQHRLPHELLEGDRGHGPSPTTAARYLAAPAWIYDPHGGCRGNAERRFDLVLDDPPSLTDAGVVQGVEGSSLALAKGAR